MRTDYGYVSMLKFEDQVNQFMSARLPKEKFTFITDKQIQYKGGDILYTGGHYIDCKIKNSTSINKIYPYPSVELSIRHGAQDGWFVKKDSITEAYFFISVFSDETDYTKITKDNIKKLNIMAFNKQELIDFIEQYVSIDDIMFEAERLLDKDCPQTRTRFYDEDTGKEIFHLTYSKKKEGAVNLVINRDIYKLLPKTKEFEIIK